MAFLISALSGTLAFVLMPPVIAFAWKIGAVDVPKDWRRMCAEVIPRDGGIAIFTAFAVGTAVYGFSSRLLVCAVAGGALLLLCGIADDAVCLDPPVKLFFQFAVALAAVLGSGFVPGYAILPAVVWVLALTNAHNLIDGMDGLFAGCAAIEGIALAATLALAGLTSAAPAALFLSAACLGFRSFNRFPAKVFAGDCGSATVGFLFGMLSLPLFSLAESFFGFLSPLFLFAYPLTDLTAAVIRRLLRGGSPLRADRAHLHHRLYAAVRDPVLVGRKLMTVSAALCVTGVLLGSSVSPIPACVSCLLTAGILIRVRHSVTDFA